MYSLNKFYKNINVYINKKTFWSINLINYVKSINYKNKERNFFYNVILIVW